MTAFGKKDRLVDIYRETRGKDKATVGLVEMGASKHVPVEVVLRHIPTGENLGAFWYADIRDVLDVAEFEFDEEERNPNLKFLGEMFREMTQLRHKYGHDLPRRPAVTLPSSIQRLIV